MEQLLFFGTAMVAFGYVGLIYWIMEGWDETVEWTLPPGYKADTKTSVIVAARNESRYIRQCIEAILAQELDWSLVELIVVDDQSTDDTRAVLDAISSPYLRVLSTSDSGHGKKAAIELAVSQATGDLIVCTDADSTMGPHWLTSILSLYEIIGPRLITAPIRYKTDRSLLQRFQYLDGIGNMGVTAAGIHYGSYYMANGANIAYEKSLFEEVGGYDGDDLASGDDMMLIQKVAQVAPATVRYLKCKTAIVDTQPVLSKSALVSQRKRWASKSKAYTDKGIIKVQAYVFGTVLLGLISLILIPFTNGFSLFSFLFLFFLKGCMDYLFLSRMADFFDNTKPLKSFMGAMLWFTIYILGAGWTALFPSSYEWKERRVS